MDELNKLINQFLADHNSAPKYGGYSRTLKKKIESKSQIQDAFITNIRLMAIVTTDPKVEVKIDALLKKFEKAGQ